MLDFLNDIIMLKDFLNFNKERFIKKYRVLGVNEACYSLNRMIYLHNQSYYDSKYYEYKAKLRKRYRKRLDKQK